MNVGILGYGVYIPIYRLTTAEIASVWGKNAVELEKSLGVKEKSVAGPDEDAVTLSFEAASLALKHAGVKASEIETCLVGSESHPYAVNPTSTIVGEFLQIGRNYFASDLEFACKAATSGMIMAAGLIAAGKVKVGLIIGSDCAQAKPHDVLEYTTASAAAAFILSDDTYPLIAKLVDFTSYSSDTPDFWRRDGVRFPSHGGRFTGEPAYFAHIEGAAKNLLEKVKMKPADFSYCVFHMPNGKYPRQIARRLGFTSQQLAPSLIIDHIGNPYTASSLLGLSAVLDQALPNQRIFMVSYGSGAGADGFVFETSVHMRKNRDFTPKVAEYFQTKKYLSYVDYLKYKGKI